MSVELLTELKKLQFQRSESSPFATHLEFMRWTDNVAPRLSFDPKLQGAFKHSVGIAKFKHNTDSSSVEQVNEAIGIVNQAVLLLESRSSHEMQVATVAPQQALLEPPPKVTIKWLYEHVPLPLVVGGVTLVTSVFVAGIAFSETQLYALVKSAISIPSKANASTSPPSNANTPSSAPQASPAPK